MSSSSSIILFGVKSPLVVDYEETIRRCGLELTAACSVSDEVRLWRRDKLKTLSECENGGCDGRFIACAFTPRNREDLCILAVKNGYAAHAGLFDPTATISESTRIGAGCYVNAGAVIGGVSILGEHVVVNRSASVGHHCILGDFSSVGPGATLAGNVRIGDRTLIGTGAVILPDVHIGEGAIVAAGSVVRKNVEDGGVVAGNPAKEITLSASSPVIGSNAVE
ncbi:MAG: DapH/DapD/GlmU-related protein [Pseudomonadota bacterium]